MRARPTLAVLVARLAAAAAALGAAGTARAYPFLSPRPVPDAIAGPTDPHAAAAFYNPAALGYLRGVHLFFDGGARLLAGNITRDGGGGSAPVTWANVESFAGLSWDLGTDTFNLGLAVYTPFVDLSSYPKSSFARYHESYDHFATLEETFAAAWKIESHASIGAGLIVDENWIDYGFSRDLAPSGGSPTVSSPNALCGGAACGYENPLAEQQLKLRGYATGIGFVVGAVVRPVERVWLGLSYTSHQTGGDLFLSDNRRARVTPAPGQGPVCYGGPCAGDDRVVLLLPEMIQAGVRVTVNPTFDVEAQWRFVHYGARDALDVTLQGGTLGRANVPQQFLIGRGLQNSYMVEVSTRHIIGQNLRLSPSLIFQSSAVAADSVNPGALDANKLEADLTLEWQAYRSGQHRFFVGAHAGVGANLIHHVSSRFDARAETTCVDQQYSLDACVPLDRGGALPTASGDYTWVDVSAGLAFGYSY